MGKYLLINFLNVYNFPYELFLKIICGKKSRNKMFRIRKFAMFSEKSCNHHFFRLCLKIIQVIVTWPHVKQGVRNSHFPLPLHSILRRWKCWEFFNHIVFAGARTFRLWIIHPRTIRPQILLFRKNLRIYILTAKKCNIFCADNFN